MGFFSKRVDKKLAAYQQDLIQTHYQEVENMYRQIRGWRHDYRNHIQTMKAYAAAEDWDAILNSKISLPLGENVAARRNYDRELVTESLEKAGFKTRLAKMPQGLSTCLYKDYTESGVSISGGEAQKIAIARALYKNAPFIILDEPTAALDPMAEAEIYEKFAEIVGDQTGIYHTLWQAQAQYYT